MNLFLLCLIAALIELDRLYIGQFSYSVPIVSGVIFGYLTGNVFAGMQTGIMATLLFIDFISIGKVVRPSGMVSVFFALTLCSLGLDLYFAFFIGVAGGVLFGFIDKFCRELFGELFFVLTKRCEENYEKIIKRYLLLSVIIRVGVSFVFMTCFIYCGKLLAGLALPQNAVFAFKIAYFTIPWLCAVPFIKRFSLRYAK